MMKEFKLRDSERILFEGESAIESFAESSLAVPTKSTTGSSKYDDEDLAGSVFLISGDGRVLSLPIPSDSPLDPLTWSRPKRVFVYSIVVLYSVVAMFLVQSPANLFAAFLKEFTMQEAEPFGIEALASSPTLFMGLSFLFWIPLSAAFGRRPIALLSSLILVIGTFWAGFTDDFDGLLFALCLIGFASGATLSIGIFQMIDLTYIHERPLAIAIFWSIGGALCLAALSQLHAFISLDDNFRILFRGMTSPALLVFFLIFFFVPETYFLRPPVAFDGRILVQSGSEKVQIYDEWIDVPGGKYLNTNTGTDTTSKGDTGLSNLRLWRASICNPKTAVACFVQIFLCLCNPLIFWVAVLNSLAFGAMMSVGIGFPTLLAQPPYNMSPSQTGLVNLSAALGSALALPASYFMLNNVAKRLTLRNKGIRHAEYYLPAFILPVIAGAASTFVFGFAAANKWAPVWYHVAYGLNAFAFAAGSVANTIWVTEAVPRWAAAAIAVVGGVSYCASVAITFALPQWNASQGYVAVNVEIGVMVLSVGLLAVPVAFWGKSVRQFVNGRWGTYEGGALRPQWTEEPEKPVKQHGRYWDQV